jgi:hypothetical protein
MEPPYTEPYVRWCERSGVNRSLLLDYARQSVIISRVKAPSREGSSNGTYGGERTGLVTPSCSISRSGEKVMSPRTISLLYKFIRWGMEQDHLERALPF